MTAVGTKEHPAPLDGLERAKPNEPVFTLQGGDPIALQVIPVYIEKRRKRALKLPEGRERDSELMRCFEAEKILWSMQEYISGRGDEPEEVPADDVAPVPEAIDLHDFRVRSTQRIGDMVANLVDIGEGLRKRKFTTGTVSLARLAHALKNTAGLIEPRRIMKRTSK